MQHMCRMDITYCVDSCLPFSCTYCMDITIQFGIRTDIINRQICTVSLYTYGMIYYYVFVCWKNMIICLNLWIYINMPIWSACAVQYDDCNWIACHMHNIANKINCLIHERTAQHEHRARSNQSMFSTAVESVSRELLDVLRVSALICERYRFIIHISWALWQYWL